jgi:hypothetical protein
MLGSKLAGVYNSSGTNPMRYVPLRGELRNIRRVDYVKKVGKGKTALWQVHFTFKNPKQNTLMLCCGD